MHDVYSLRTPAAARNEARDVSVPSLAFFSGMLVLGSLIAAGVFSGHAIIAQVFGGLTIGGEIIIGVSAFRFLQQILIPARVPADASPAAAGDLHPPYV